MPSVLVVRSIYIYLFLILLSFGAAEEVMSCQEFKISVPVLWPSLWPFAFLGVVGRGWQLIVWGPLPEIPHRIALKGATALCLSHSFTSEEFHPSGKYYS